MTLDLAPIKYVVFDVLWHNGIDWTQCSLEERRTQLRSIVSESDRIVLSRVFPDGRALLAAAKANGFDGIVAKDRHSIYELADFDGTHRRTATAYCALFAG